MLVKCLMYLTTCLSCACRSLKSLNDSISVQPAVTCSSPQGSSWTHMVVVPLPWLRRQLGIHVGWTAKPGSPQCHLPTQLEDVPVSTILGTLSALEALCDYALYKSTFTLHLHLHYITLSVIVWWIKWRKIVQSCTSRRLGRTNNDV